MSQRQGVELPGNYRSKCDGTRAETRFRLSAKRTSPFKSAGGEPVQSTTGSRGVRISGSNAGYTVFRGSVKSTGYPLHSPVSPSLPRPCVTLGLHISTGVYSFLLDDKSAPGPQWGRKELPGPGGPQRGLAPKYDSYVFIFLDVVVCRRHKITLRRQAHVTLQLRVSLYNLV